MSRLSRRLARKHRAAVSNPPSQAATARLKRAVGKLRRTARGDPATMEIVNEAEKLIASGWTVRRGGPDEPKRAEPLPEWKKPPPETP